MATSLVQPFVDQENAASVNTTSRKSSTTTASRQITGKTFSSSTAPFTPRQAFSDISNDPVRRALGNVTNTVKKPGLSSTVKKGLATKKITLKKSIQTPSTQSFRKQKIKSNEAVKPRIHEDSYPPIESMHIYEDKLPDLDVLPAEHRLSNLDLLKRSMPLLQTGVRDVDDLIPDFSFMSLYPPQRPDTEPADLLAAAGSRISDFMLDVPPVDDVDIDSLLRDLEI